MKTPEEYYEQERKRGNTRAITSNPDPDYSLSFYQTIFQLMEGYYNERNK